MSKSKFKVQKGLAFVVSTGEPVFIKGFSFVTNLFGEQEAANVVRAVVTQNGIEYRNETFPIEELETRFEQAKRGVEFEQYVQSLREEAESKRYSLNKQQLDAIQQAALQAKNPSKQLSFEGING